MDFNILHSLVFLSGIHYIRVAYSGSFLSFFCGYRMACQFCQIFFISPLVPFQLIIVMWYLFSGSMGFYQPHMTHFHMCPQSTTIVWLFHWMVVPMNLYVKVYVILIKLSCLWDWDLLSIGLHHMLSFPP